MLQLPEAAVMYVQYWILLDSIVFYCILLYSTVLYCTVLYCIVLYNLGENGRSIRDFGSKKLLAKLKYKGSCRVDYDVRLLVLQSHYNVLHYCNFPEG